MAATQNYGTGRRKSAIARVWLTPGEGNISVNGRDFKEYLGRPVLEILLKSPLVHLGMEARYDVKAYTKGGGITGQAGAIKHVWLIILENKSYDATFTGLNQNSYLWKSLPAQGVLLKNYYGTGHYNQNSCTAPPAA